MNYLKQKNKPIVWFAQRIPILGTAACLLAATSLPVIEIKGFDTFDFASVALWAGKIARCTIGAAIFSSLLPSLFAARWLLALSVGIIFSPLLDMVVRSRSLAEMMNSGDGEDFKSMIIPLIGLWVAALGLTLWIADLLIEGVKTLLGMKSRSSQLM
jgi:hypothetical protein